MARMTAAAAAFVVGADSALSQGRHVPDRSPGTSTQPVLDVRGRHSRRDGQNTLDPNGSELSADHLHIDRLHRHQRADALRPPSQHPRCFPYRSHYWQVGKPPFEIAPATGVLLDDHDDAVGGPARTEEARYPRPPPSFLPRLPATSPLTPWAETLGHPGGRLAQGDPHLSQTVSPVVGDPPARYTSTSTPPKTSRRRRRSSSITCSGVWW